MATKKEIIDYVMSSPANTNPNVLGSMLDGIVNAGEGSRLRVNIANSSKTEGTITVTYDKTWQEVHDALESGMDVTYEYTSGMYLRIFEALSLPFGPSYNIRSEMLGSDGSSVPMLVVNGTFFTSLTSPDDYLVAQGGSSSGSDIDPPIGTTT